MLPQSSELSHMRTLVLDMYNDKQMVVGKVMVVTLQLVKEVGGV